jgi:hypothetical protein
MEPQVIEAFKAGGASVEQLPPGNSRPDLLVGFLRVNHLIEVKTNEATLDAGQEKWHREWKGEPVPVVRTGPQARKWLAIWTREFAASPRPDLTEDLAAGVGR